MTYLPIAAILFSFFSIAVLLLTKVGKKIQDVPNERSLHAAPIPRIGGIGLIAGVLASWLLLPGELRWWIVLPLLLLFGISLIDDMRGLPVRLRLTAHLVAAALLVAGSGLHLHHGVLVVALVWLVTVWMTNLYNFMDGSDGLAGGMALFGFAAYGAAAWLAQDNIFAVLNLSVSAAALGFLFHNFPPAKVFMGDAGSVPLGFLAAAMGLWGWEQGCWSAWFPLLVFSPFIVDATITLLRRSLRGAKVTEAHREHYYHRAIQLGWSHRKVALVEYVLMLAVSMSALLAVQQILPWQALLIWGAIYAGIMLALDARWKRSQAGASR